MGLVGNMKTEIVDRRAEGYCMQPHAPGTHVKHMGEGGLLCVGVWACCGAKP